MIATDNQLTCQPLSAAILAALTKSAAS
ncbi:MAG: hypothetical protein QOE84_452, partial [Actinomycetota bacterium]|nr:hypothetical protein [Actinomycetota bacterium]